MSFDCGAYLRVCPFSCGYLKAFTSNMLVYKQKIETHAKIVLREYALVLKSITFLHAHMGKLDLAPPPPFPPGRQDYSFNALLGVIWVGQKGRGGGD